MPKKAKVMGAAQLGRLPVGRHAVGGAAGLHLTVTPNDARCWILRVSVGGRRRDMGLGGWPDVTLAQARDKAREARALIDQGIDPVEQRKAARANLRSTPTFRWCAEQTVNAKRPEWKSGKHADQWTYTLKEYAGPVIGNMPVDQVTLPDIVHVLQPIWTSKTETASRLRARIEAVLAWATASGYRQGDNPARWRNNLDAVLAKPHKVAKVEHLAAMPVDAMHDFVQALRKREGMGARAVEFAILTAARSGEVRGATWDEIDLDGAVWTVPAERMKAGREHRVALSAPAVKLLKALPRFAGTDLVFPAARGRQLSDMTLTKTLRRMGETATVHGFRSSFRDWAAERTSYPREVAEAALAHRVGDAAELAYKRTDMLAKRARLMRDWSKFIDTPTGTADVVPIKRARS